MTGGKRVRSSRRHPVGVFNFPSTMRRALLVVGPTIYTLILFFPTWSGTFLEAEALATKHTSLNTLAL